MAIGSHGQIVSKSSNGNTLTMYNPDDDEKNSQANNNNVGSGKGSGSLASFRSLRGNKSSLKRDIGCGSFYFDVKS